MSPCGRAWCYGLAYVWCHKVWRSHRGTLMTLCCTEWGWWQNSGRSWHGRSRECCNTSPHSERRRLLAVPRWSKVWNHGMASSTQRMITRLSPVSGPLVSCSGGRCVAILRLHRGSFNTNKIAWLQSFSFSKQQRERLVRGTAQQTHHFTRGKSIVWAL